MMTADDLPRPLHAIVFDMDGTLLDTERLYHEALHAAAAAGGHAIPPALYAAMVGVHREVNQRMLTAHFGPSFPVEAFFADTDARRAALTHEGIPLRPGVLPLLDALQAAGMRCAIATSTIGPDAQDHLARAGLIDYFETIVTRSDVLHPKPAPDPYLLAAARLGLDPGTCLAVEDSPNGVRAAAAAGMPTIMIPDLIPATAETEGLTIATLPGLADLQAVLGLTAGRYPPSRTASSGRAG